MNKEQAYINGFVKRASEYGIGQNDAIELLKSSGFYDNYIAPAIDKTKAFIKDQMTDPLAANVSNPDFNKAVAKNYYKSAPADKSLLTAPAIKPTVSTGTYTGK